ncbi:MAG: lipoprotein signal peptidase [Saprospiraceae bacterium]
MTDTITNPAALRKRTILCVLTVLAVIFFDQCLKIWVKTNMEYGSEFKILGLNWARVHFVENEGMAFGISLGGNMGKLFLSVFRILAVGFLIYILIRLIKSNEKWGLLVCFSLILAGAIGNILDSAFYGLMFTESYYQGGVAEYAPDKGYAPFLFGRVVDMLYFPMIDTRWPSWVPIIGGDPFQFFRPVFNIADAAISTGVISLIVFFRSFFKSPSETAVTSNHDVQSTNPAPVAESLNTPEETKQ